VTRSTDQASALTALLSQCGALPIELPTIKIEPAADSAQLDLALLNLREYSWVVFTSANGVRCVRQRLLANGIPLDQLETLRIAAIGSATARSLTEYGVRVDAVPTKAVGESLVDALASHDLRGKRILLPVARDAREVVASGLTARGAIVERIVAYETRAIGDPAAARQAVASGDVITLTSGSTVRSLAALIGEDVGSVLQSRVVASIGPVTTSAASEQGIRVDVEATEHTIVGLVAAIEAWLASAQAATS
jgi:uroporphyrinogen III methyltransferase/synthase